MFNAGAYDNDYVPRLLKFCKRSPELRPTGAGNAGHFHYAHYYWSQVLYREGGEDWENYRDQLYRRLLTEQDPKTGAWTQSYVGPVYTTATNLTILQLEKANLPIYQK
jgi:hypothetical protein